MSDDPPRRALVLLVAVCGAIPAAAPGGVEVAHMIEGSPPRVVAHARRSYTMRRTP